MTTAAEEARARIDAACPGWSDARHWEFFKNILDPEGFSVTYHGGGLIHGPIKHVCLCGVYQGRDIAYMKYHRPSLEITGVDLFSDKAMADWPVEKRGMTWQEAGFGEPPSRARVKKNLDAVMDPMSCNGLALLERDAAPFLREVKSPLREAFDLIYIDTSHDYETTRDTIAAAVSTGCGLIAGDDYADGQQWGVKRAVQEAFTEHQVFGDWIWLAEARHYKGVGQ